MKAKRSVCRIYFKNRVCSLKLLQMTVEIWIKHIPECQIRKSQFWVHCGFKLLEEAFSNYPTCRGLRMIMSSQDLSHKDARAGLKTCGSEKIFK